MLQRLHKIIKIISYKIFKLPCLIHFWADVLLLPDKGYELLRCILEVKHDGSEGLGVQVHISLLVPLPLSIGILKPLRNFLNLSDNLSHHSCHDVFECWFCLLMLCLTLRVATYEETGLIAVRVERSGFDFLFLLRPLINCEVLHMVRKQRISAMR